MRQNKQKNEFKITEQDLKTIYGDDYDFFLTKILPNCFCQDCTPKSGSVTISNYQIFLNDLNDIVLRGFCAKCGGKIGRYLETGEVEEYAWKIKKMKKEYGI